MELKEFKDLIEPKVVDFNWSLDHYNRTGDVEELKKAYQLGSTIRQLIGERIKEEKK